MSESDLRSFPAFPFVDFEEPTDQWPWFGFNPQARGHRRCAAVHRVVFHIVAIGFAGAGIVAGIWFGRIDAALGGVALGILISSLCEFVWRRMRYCRHCGATVSHPLPRTSCDRCPACLRLVDAEDFIRTLGEAYDPDSPNKERWEDPYYRFVGVLLNLVFAVAAKRVFMVDLGERIGLGVYEEAHGGQPDYEVQDPPTHCFAPARELLEIMSQATPDPRGGLTGEFNANVGNRLMRLHIRIKEDAVAISVVEETRMCA
jgi:hypothetical protein